MQADLSTSVTLLDRVRGRDEAAWARLVALYGPLVYAWCYRKQVAAHDVADVVQEVFIAVARGIAGFRKDAAGGSFRGWLRVITKTRVADYFRRKEKRPVAFGGDLGQRYFESVEATAAIDDGETDERAWLKQRALQLLQSDFEEKTWRAFWKTAIQGRSGREVADELGMSENAVWNARYKVLQRLKSELGDLLD